MTDAELLQQQQITQVSPPASANADRPIIRRGSGSGLLARRRSRSRGTSASSVTFDLALEIPPEGGYTHPDYQRTQSSYTRMVHRIEHDSQLIVRHCFRLALTHRLNELQAGQIAEVLDVAGTGLESSISPVRLQESLAFAALMTAMTAELRATRQGQIVLRKVLSVNLQSMNRAEFEHHMESLIKTDSRVCYSSRTRISNILLFDTELALIAIRSSDRLAFCQVLNWSLDYFRRTVSAWVVRAGGWDKVAQEPTKVVASVAFVLSVLLLGRALLRLIRGS